MSGLKGRIAVGGWFRVSIRGGHRGLSRENNVLTENKRNAYQMAHTETGQNIGPGNNKVNSWS